MLKQFVLILLCINFGFTQSMDTSTASEEDSAKVLPLRNFAIEFLPPMTGLSLSGSIEWLPIQTKWFGFWAGGQYMAGDNWISGLEQYSHLLFGGITWHPSKNILGHAMYMRYLQYEMESEFKDADKYKTSFKMSGKYIGGGYLNRGNWWKGLGYYWNGGLRIPIGDVDFKWQDTKLPEDANTIGKMMRIISCLDLSAGIQWSW